MTKNRKWQPTVESSPGASGYRSEPAAEDDSLILIVEGEDCYCGCGHEHHPKYQFIRGHDQRLKGKLSRAALAGVEVSLQSGMFVTGSALSIAAHLLQPEGVAQVEDLIRKGEKARAEQTKSAE
jgi:hypothetical protein